MRATAKDLLRFDLLNPTRETVRFPLPTGLPIPDFPVFDGHACVTCSFATRPLSSMEKHHRQLHPSGRKPDRPSACTPSSSSAPRRVAVVVSLFVAIEMRVMCLNMNVVVTLVSAHFVFDSLESSSIFLLNLVALGRELYHFAKFAFAFAQER